MLRQARLRTNKLVICLGETGYPTKPSSQACRTSLFGRGDLTHAIRMFAPHRGRRLRFGKVQLRPFVGQRDLASRDCYPIDPGELDSYFE